MSPEPGTLAWDLRHDFFRVCAFIVANAFLANFLPSASRFNRWPRAKYLYCVLVDLVAGFGLNWRTQLPSLDQEFIGFKRIIRHKYRNWRQLKMDAEHLSAEELEQKHADL